MNVSRNGQRVLHALAQGGVIRLYKDENGRFSEVECLTREGWLLSLCTMDLFKMLRRKGLVASSNGGPYRITRLGLSAVRSRPDNR
ncbi:YjhX family toxin [Microvirga rosea]|uniref:YjhX family toxin n=1 Tax=Microvirga rosea TaxID=2715425 RepID=UPI001D0AE7F1|nr:YjhX family toxin [Microvirga rosea]MCB8819600.1 YjhX family toxin [Microvirga rosea]